MVAKLLGHKQTRTTERYAHLAADPILAAVDQTANRIAAAMRIGGGNVVVPGFSAKQPQHEDTAATKSGGGRRPASQ
jgi:hypothetical protein